MKIRVPLKDNFNLALAVKRAGYFRILDRQSGKESFVRKPTRERYPRFHLYVSQREEQLILDLHLDQSATRYEGQTAHRADHDSPEVKQELTRIYYAIEELLR